MKGVNFILKGVVKELNSQALKEFDQIFFKWNFLLCFTWFFFMRYYAILKISKKEYVVL